MNLALYKIIAAGLIFVVSILTVVYPLKKKGFKHPESIELAEALASGIFLSAAFFHLLPESIAKFQTAHPGHVGYLVPEMICVFGFLFLVFLDRLSLVQSTVDAKHSIPYILAIILFIHAFIEGAALGIGKTISGTVMFFIAIIAHKASESFALCITMLRHQLPFNRILWIVILFAFMTPLGISMGILLNEFAAEKPDQLLSAAFQAFAAGTFLYISTLHHIHFHQHMDNNQGLLEFASLVTGVLMMTLIAVWV